MRKVLEQWRNARPVHMVCRLRADTRRDTSARPKRSVKPALEKSHVAQRKKQRHENWSPITRRVVVVAVRTQNDVRQHVPQRDVRQLRARKQASAAPQLVGLARGRATRSLRAARRVVGSPGTSSLKSWLGLDPAARFEAGAERGVQLAHAKAADAWATMDPEARYELQQAAGSAAAAKEVIAAQVASPTARTIIAARSRSRLINRRHRRGTQLALNLSGVRTPRTYAARVPVSRLRPLVSTRPKTSRRKKKSNPIYFPRQPKNRGGRPARQAWWIADVYKGNRRRPRTFIERGTKTEAERGAMRLLTMHRAKSVELSGPYARQPTTKTARK